MHSDLKTLSTALAFAAITSGDDVTDDKSTTVLALAKEIEEFCNEHASKVSTDASLNAVDDVAFTDLDATIERHIGERRRAQNVALPSDKYTLLQFYDRLQQRKSRRMQGEFYAMATEAKLQDLVLHYLDEEIEDIESRS